NPVISADTKIHEVFLVRFIQFLHLETIPLSIGKGASPFSWLAYGFATQKILYYSRLGYY
ncbi:MAG: hypothetical protein U9N37_08595, partial [Thermodesulfobacteriota bacterium]|nr:hypothetical protein [Thermodesulfobacteriota bacterium]